MSRPRATYVPPVDTLSHPARSDLHPAHGENLPEVTSGALFHGYSHVLREVP